MIVLACKESEGHSNRLQRTFYTIRVDFGRGMLQNNAQKPNLSMDVTESVMLLGSDLGFGMNALVGSLVGLHMVALLGSDQCNILTGTTPEERSLSHHLTELSWTTSRQKYEAHLGRGPASPEQAVVVINMPIALNKPVYASMTGKVADSMRKDMQPEIELESLRKLERTQPGTHLPNSPAAPSDYTVLDLTPLQILRAMPHSPAHAFLA
ncbi:hypothetical protein CCR75_002321 [Bremia lactucae]|uniref:Uncharacterized protein n=1 Tax=Bremia lactucae TaxID=4779 RepID=A0A976IKR4_BRELC|nr:hypothetical protein CCR75_002321 [Bremia lactucae]